MSKYKILFVTMNYTIPVNGVAECNGVKFWFKYKNIDNMSDIDYNNLEYIISELSDDYYKIIYDNHQDFCKKSGKQFYHTNDDDLIIINNMKPPIKVDNVDNVNVDNVNVDNVKVDNVNVDNVNVDNVNVDNVNVDNVNVDNVNVDNVNDDINQIKEKFESMMNSVVHTNKINYIKIQGNYITTIKSDDFINFNGTNIVNNKI